MPTELAERREERSQSPSAAQRVLREQMRFLREISTAEEAVRQTRGRRNPTSSLPVTNVAFTPGEVQEVLHQLRAFQDEWSLRDVTKREPLPDVRAPLHQPPPCSFLRPGQVFSGNQRVTHWTPGKAEQWQVSVTLHSYDHARGQIFGTMTARDIPEAELPVVTFFQGEIIDNINNSFYTSHTDWAALAETDIRHWARFPAYHKIRQEVETYGGRAPGLDNCGAVFMRWKEQFFVTGGECRLTIAGFYYCCLDRATGAIQALYFDPASSPDQRLDLQPCAGGEAGYAFPAHELA